MKERINIIACKVFQPELDAVLAQIKEENLFTDEIVATYLHAGLHCYIDKLKETILESLEMYKNDKIILLYGHMCHPHFKEMLEGYNVVPFPENNCVKLIMPDAPSYEKGTVYVTTGWIMHWRELIQDPFGGLDIVGTRQNFGLYDTMIFGDAGVAEITDEHIIDVFDVFEVPIETKEITLDYFKNRIINSIKSAVEA